jgi:hypothetical protein|tara:strand:- start:5702 stop:5881 length:180 start_codon:yes stop_codon:yes gene_type:complete
MGSSALQSAIVSFTVISLIVSIFYVEELQKSKRKHILAGGFIFLGAFMYALMLVLDLKV